MIPSVERMRQELGIMKLMEVIRLGRLRWFEHVRRREESSWARRCMDMENEDRNPKIGPMLTWRQMVRQDVK